MARSVRVGARFGADRADLYPLLFVLPDSLVLTIAGSAVTAWNPYDMSEMALANVPNNQQLLYPASGASAILPLTPANNYTATILGCGGINMANVDANWSVGHHSARADLAGTTPGPTFRPTSPPRPASPCSTRVPTRNG